jgi:hypothetical protein
MSQAVTFIVLIFSLYVRKLMSQAVTFIVLLFMLENSCLKQLQLLKWHFSSTGTKASGDEYLQFRAQ